MTNRQNGFTLLEVTMALAIFGVGLLALATMQVAAMNGKNSSSALTEAVTLAADRMEKLMSSDYGAAPELDDADDDGAAGLSDASAAEADNQDPRDLGRYQVFWNIAEDTTTNNSKTVNVIVTWNVRGATRTLAMQGIRAR